MAPYAWCVTLCSVVVVPSPKFQDQESMVTFPVEVYVNSNSKPVTPPSGSITVKPAVTLWSVAL